VAGLKEKFRLVDEVYRVSIGNAAPLPAAK